MDLLHINPSSTLHAPPFVKRQRQPAKHTQIWTTTRCHRLLRPLKTHILALRRDIELENSELLGDGGSADAALGTAGAQSPKKGRLQRTYSRRGRKPGLMTSSQTAPSNSATSKTKKSLTRRAMQPGEIVLPTPFIRRARGLQLSSPVQQPKLKGHEPTTQGKRPHCAELNLAGSPNGFKPPSLVSALEVEMLPLRSRIPSDRCSLYESILRALHALLVATPVPTTAPSSWSKQAAPRSNNKSLMAMCLRKVPEYIGELEYWEQRDAEEKGTKSTLHGSEASNQVYEALEDMLPSSHGCPQLRAVVREHGMQLVRDTLAEGLLDDGFSLLLVALCFRTRCYLEAEGLLEIILDRSYPKPKNVDSTFDDGRRLAPLKTLRDFARESHRPQFMLRQLSKLITAQQLSIEWLSTKEFATIWSEVVKTLSGDAVCDDTVAFAVHFITSLSFQAVLPIFTLRPEKGDLKSLAQQTLLSAITALVSLTLLRREAKRLSTQNTACAISHRIGYTIEACMIEMRRRRRPGWIATILSLAAYFTSITEDGAKVDISDLWRHVLQDRRRRDRKQHYEAAMSLISSLASCCARGAPEPSHYYFTRFVDQLDRKALVDESESWNLRVDCAFFLAERTNDMRDLAYAESFSNTASPETKSASVTPRKSSVTGFRWDGDISEWVTATPAPALWRNSSGAPKKTRQDETDDDDECISDSEASSAIHRRRISPRRRTRSSAALPSSRCAQQVEEISAPASSRRKRKRNMTLPSESEEDDEKPHPQILRRVSGQEDKAGLAMVSAGPKKRRRAPAAIATVVMQQRRGVMRTITNTGHEDLSDDELGL